MSVGPRLEKNASESEFQSRYVTANCGVRQTQAKEEEESTEGEWRP